MEQNKISGNNTGLRKSGIVCIVRSWTTLLLQMVIFFSAAGHFKLMRAWIFFGITLIYSLISTLLQLKFNPELINERAGDKANTKAWDKKILLFYAIFGFLLLPTVIGLDAGRFHWSNLDINMAIIGYVLFILSCIFATWSMVVNQYFEATVRIQDDRNHQVVNKGPYKLVRHPGYVGGILWAISFPLIIGSLYGLIIGIIVLIILAIRTALEDKMLQDELAGYAEYAKNVKYRLLPGVW